MALDRARAELQGRIVRLASQADRCREEIDLAERRLLELREELEENLGMAAEYRAIVKATAKVKDPDPAEPAPDVRGVVRHRVMPPTSEATEVAAMGQRLLADVALNSPGRALALHLTQRGGQWSASVEDVGPAE